MSDLQGRKGSEGTGPGSPPEADRPSLYEPHELKDGDLPPPPPKVGRVDGRLREREDLPEQDPKESSEQGQWVEVRQPGSKHEHPLRRRSDRSVFIADPPKAPTETGEAIREVDTSPEGAVEGFIERSLKETGKAVQEYVFEKLVVLVADAVHPGLGRMIEITFKIQEVADDVEALVDPGSGCVVHVPLMDVPPGFQIEASVHVPPCERDRAQGPSSHERAGADGLSVSVFASPGDGGLFGGWAIKREEGPPATEQKRPSTGQEAGQQPGAATFYSLPENAKEAEPFLRAVHMRDVAAVMQHQLQDIPRRDDAPLIAVDDERAGWGLWMIRAEQSEVGAGRSMEIRCNLVTGLTTVFIK
jgi:hypothetical protein